MDLTFKVQPHGGSKVGNSWDDKGKTGITHIFVQHQSYVNSIQTAYVTDGTTFLLLSDKHGGDDSSFFDTVNINYPSEFLTCVSGYSDSSWFTEGKEVIKSLTFSTNQGTYGPFGPEEGTPFRFNMGKERGFGGFHGSSDSDYLYSIGVYVKPISPLIDRTSPSDDVAFLIG